MNFVNQTPYPAGWTIGFEPDGRELLVIAVKATYSIPVDDQPPELAKEQIALVEADTFTGEPGYSATLYETDFAHRKPTCDVLFNGSAYAPDGRPAERITVSLQVGRMKKAFIVVGDRRWERIMLQDTPSLAIPFDHKQISYDRAFGGTDIDDRTKERLKSYLLNPIGIGFYPYSTGAGLEGKPLPDTEEIGKPIKSAKTGDFSPMALGPMGRNFGWRTRYAGTYDQSWLENHAPFWPDDFSPQYFQAAPSDQLIPYPGGGEPVILQNLTPAGTTAFALPTLHCPIVICPYQGRAKQVMPQIDTVVIEPDHGRLTMTSRLSYPLTCDCFELKEVVVGETIKKWHQGRGNDRKPYYPNLSRFIEARKSRYTVTP